MEARPDLERTGKEIQDALFELGMACLKAGHENLDADRVLQTQALLTCDVPALHRLLGQWQVLERLSGRLHDLPTVHDLPLVK